MTDEPARPPLRLLQICTRYGAGGIQRHVLNLRDALQSQGHSVWLAGSPDVWAGPGQDSNFLELPIRLVSAEGGSTRNRLIYAARAAWMLRRWLGRHPVDVIHCHESAPALVALLARAWWRIPIAISYHGADPERIASFSRIARRCDLVFATNHRSGDELLGAGLVAPERLRIVELGLAAAPDDSACEVDALRTRLLGGGTRLVVTIARLSHQKGIDVLIECVARLTQEHPDWRFVIAGDGSQEAQLRALATSRGVDTHLAFVGRTERPHLYLRAADLFLLTSRWEAKPLAISEAFQTGTPAVATACSGVLELIDDTVGRVVPIGDIDAICDAVTCILSDDRLRARLAANARRRGTESEQFQTGAIHRQFEQCYRALADDG